MLSGLTRIPKYLLDFAQVRIEPDIGIDRGKTDVEQTSNTWSFGTEPRRVRDDRFQRTIGDGLAGALDF